LLAEMSIVMVHLFVLFSHKEAKKINAQII